VSISTIPNLGGLPGCWIDKHFVSTEDNVEYQGIFDAFGFTVEFWQLASRMTEVQLWLALIEVINLEEDLECFIAIIWK
jgi:hypothetical protein